MKQLILGFSLVILALTPIHSQAQSELARDFFKENVLVDGVCFPYYRPGSTLQRFLRDANGKIDMGEFRSSTGVDIGIWDLRSEDEMLKYINGIKRGDFTNVRVIRNFSDIEAVISERKHGWLFYTQHPWPLRGSIAPIEGWHRNGLRVIQITYGSSIAITPGDELGTGSSRNDLDDSGLTDLGLKVIKECNRLGILLDTSHCNLQTTLDVAKHSTSPVICSHAGCEAVTPAKRNKSDEEIRAIAKTGGIIGITPIKFMLSDNPERGATMNDFIHHLEHAIMIAGIDHVGIAADIKRNGVPDDEIHAYTCQQLNGEDRWFYLYDALKAKGYSDADQAKIFGLNYLRILKAVLK